MKMSGWPWGDGRFAVDAHAAGILRILLEAGADANQAGSAGLSGYTALHMAGFAGNEAAARVLIAHGADKTLVSPGDGTAYEIAQAKNYFTELSNGEGLAKALRVTSTDGLKNKVKKKRKQREAAKEAKRSNEATPPEKGGKSGYDANTDAGRAAILRDFAPDVERPTKPFGRLGSGDL
eukprot:SAG22_NODE_432_length_10559_cov_29.404225_2_plen_179_part_00